MDKTISKNQQLNPASKKPSLLRFNLFFKVLVWFWLTMILIITLNLFIGQINSERIRYHKISPSVDKDFEKYTRKIQSILKHRKGLQSPARSERSAKRDRRLFKRTFLLNKAGEDIIHRKIPQLLSDLHHRTLHNEMLNNTVVFSVFQKNTVFTGGSTVEFNGKEYYLYRYQHIPVFSRRFVGLFFKEVATSLLITTLIISFPVSFFLAWLLSRPIRQLQRSTQEIAENLSNKQRLEPLVKRNDEFGDLARDFKSMACQLEQHLNSQKQLLSDVSHELRSPLTRMQLALGLMEKKGISVVQDDLLRIKRESDRMNEMLENLLTISRLESQELQHKKESFDFCQLILSVVDNTQFEAQQAQVELVTRLPERLDFIGVQEALISGLENLVRNAICYAGQGGTVNISLANCNGQLKLTVSDTGPGIAEEHLSKIFDSFYRPQSDRNMKTGGVGLGLSIARRAFALNDGQISAENGHAEGLVISVVFSLPAKRN